MAGATYSVPIQDLFGETATLATTLATAGVINTKNGYRGLQFYCASDWKLLLTPRLAYVVFYDASATSYTNYTANALDRDATTDVTLGAMTTSDYLYIFTPEVIGGLDIDMDATLVNALAADLDVEYYKSTGWTDVAGDSDGTKTATETLSQDGLYTWTAPTDAVVLPASASVNNISGLYGIRFTTSATLTANTAINGLVAIHKGTDYVIYQAGNTEVLTYDNDHVGGLQFLSVSGTPTLNIGWIKYRG